MWVVVFVKLRTFDFGCYLGTGKESFLPPRGQAEKLGLYGFLCQPSRARYLLVNSGSRSSNMMAKWFNASFQRRTGIVQRCEASRIAM